MVYQSIDSNHIYYKSTRQQLGGKSERFELEGKSGTFKSKHCRLLADFNLIVWTYLIPLASLHCKVHWGKELQCVIVCNILHSFTKLHWRDIFMINANVSFSQSFITLVSIDPFAFVKPMKVFDKIYEYSAKQVIVKISTRWILLSSIN